MPARGLEAALEQGPGAITDHRPDIGQSEARPTELGQDLIQMCVQIRGGVDQRPVEIEHDSVERRATISSLLCRVSPVR